MDTATDGWNGRLAAFVVRRAWWMVAAWIAVAVAVNVFVPQLETVVAEDSTPVVPEEASSVRGFQQMDREFGTGKSTSSVVVVIGRDSRLTRADETYFRELGPRLRADTENVSFVQDVVGAPEILPALTSDDGKAMYLQVGLPGQTGAPDATQQIAAVRDHAEVAKPDGLKVEVTGQSATIADMVTEIEHNILRITVATVVLIGIILLVLYRSVAVTVLILGAIGLGLGVGRGLTALMGEMGLFGVSSLTVSFLTAVMLGASTDYAVFLVSRYHEHRRAGLAPLAAAISAGGRISGVIVGSALTVIVGSIAMAFTDLGLFNTTGPAVAVSVAVALAVALTLTPAVLAIAGSRGLMEPRRERSRDWWQQVSSAVVARPGRMLAAGLLPLALLAAFYPAMDVSFDEREVQSDDSGSNQGYQLIADHFPVNEVLPDFVLVAADRDLRNPADLAALEQAAGSVSRTEGVTEVRAVTRPEGKPIGEASIGRQAGEIGDNLDEAGRDLGEGQDRADELADGAAQLDDGAGRVAGGAGAAAGGAGQLLDGVGELKTGLDRLVDGAGQAKQGSKDIRSGAREMADALALAYAQTKPAVDGLGLAYQGLQQSPTCGLDPICAKSREGVRQVFEGQRDQLLPGLQEASDGARLIADGSDDLTTGLKRLESGLEDAQAGARQVGDGQRTLTAKLGDLAQGADEVSDGTGRVADGTSKVSGSVGELEDGLVLAAEYLRGAGRAAKDPAVGGFYLPPEAFDDERLRTATSLYLSPDGRTARLIVLGASDPLKRPAADRYLAVRDAAGEGLRGTGLQDAAVTSTGAAGVNADLAEYSTKDLRLVMIFSLLAVFVILALLLRSIVAPLFLVGSVVLSYLAAMGLGTLVWEIGIGQPMDWTVPTFAFVLLVAVGADYNLLLMKRIHEESPDGSRAGIARALTATGGVITAAGLIFAASMFAFLAGSVDTLAQIGFTVGMGLLLDTFIVRTLVVPSIAALLGRAVWWPRADVRSGSHEDSYQGRSEKASHGAMPAPARRA